MGASLPPPLAVFFQAVLLGLSAGLVYDLLRAVRLRLPRLTAPLDLAFCACGTAAVFLFSLRQTGGQLRLYVLLGAAAGCWLFFRHDDQLGKKASL